MPNSLTTSLWVSEAVGSSMTRIRVFRASALVISTICFCPTLRLASVASGSTFTSSFSRSSTAFCRIARRSRNWPLLISLFKKMFSVTLSVGTPLIS